MIEKNLISRRRFLRGIALAGAGAALAACAAPPAAQPPAPKAAEPTAAAPVAATAAPAAAAATEAPKATEAPAAPAAAGKTGEFHGAFPYQVPPTGHWNSFANDGISQGVAIYQDLLEMPMARLKWATGEYVPLMATKWGFDGENFTVTLRDGAKWSDDSAFSSKDVVDTFLIGRLFKWTIYNYVDKVEAKDATTVVFHMNKASTLVQRLVGLWRIGRKGCQAGRRRQEERQR